MICALIFHIIKETSSLKNKDIAVIGSKAPQFVGTAVNTSLEFEEVSLDHFKGKWVVLFSYPLDFTYVCPTEIIAFSNVYEEFKKINCEVIGISTDSVYSHLEWMEKPKNKGGLGKINIKLIGDLGAKISKKYNFYDENLGHNMRGTVIIDPEGIIKHVSMTHPNVGRNVNEVLRLVKAFQFSEKHKKVCPAQWEEGKDAINPNLKDSKEYFEKNYKTSFKSQANFGNEI